ncbi:MAG: SDR family NAD(P)-dependent oxidoreductase [Alkalispirochaeta sp.]
MSVRKGDTHKPGVDLSFSHAVITGGARGIGLATARRLIGAGSRVSLWDLDGDALAAAKAELTAAIPDAQVHTETCDITDHNGLRRALSGSTAALGSVDVLINNAGHLAPGQFVDQEAETWMSSLEVNLNSLVYLTRLVIPGMYERGYGHIVNISSAAGTIGVPGLAVYSAAKWAVWGFSEALRAESRPHGVMVSSIHPSYIAEGMFAGARLKGVGRVIVPLLRSHDVVAQSIVESALRRGRSSPKRPRTVRIAILLRGILPDPWFNGLMKHLGVWDSMSGWRGRTPER